ncbi:hypothetical protein ACFLIM_00100 [Nonomuraea sp. M3C6]|uniref:Uncharacterized protein n=1 Tax=Nonomuraea marmarensis TaxID=3351344 RepID=A0ABW7A312_9ACTN
MNSNRALWRYKGVRTWVSWIVVAPFAGWAALRLSGLEPDWPWVYR